MCTSEFWESTIPLVCRPPSFQPMTPKNLKCGESHCRWHVCGILLRLVVVEYVEHCIPPQRRWLTINWQICRRGTMSKVDPEGAAPPIAFSLHMSVHQCHMIQHNLDPMTTQNNDMTHDVHRGLCTNDTPTHDPIPPNDNNTLHITSHDMIKTTTTTYQNQQYDPDQDFQTPTPTNHHHPSPSK